MIAIVTFSKSIPKIEDYLCPISFFSRYTQIYLLNHSNNLQQLTIAMVTNPMRFGSPFTLLIQYLLLLITTAPTYIFIASLAFMNSL